MGPAGTGKTYLAMAMAVAALNRHEVSRRDSHAAQAVEAGEKLGFLPGDLAEKVNPYMRPLYDALHDMMEFREGGAPDGARRDRGGAPGLHAGRTLERLLHHPGRGSEHHPEQMKMFLTRLGFDSKAVIRRPHADRLAGRHQRVWWRRLQVLLEVEGIGFMRFSDADVVRHPLVQSIILAYDRADRAQKADREARDPTDRAAARDEVRMLRCRPPSGVQRRPARISILKPARERGGSSSALAGSAEPRSTPSCRSSWWTTPRWPSSTPPGGARSAPHGRALLLPARGPITRATAASCWATS